MPYGIYKHKIGVYHHSIETREKMEEAKRIYWLNKPKKIKVKKEKKIPVYKYPLDIRLIFPSGSKRERVREMVRIRDNHTCQICSKIWNGKERRFDVHHIDCIKEKSRQCDDYEIEKDNMITLCHKCHLSLPEHRQKMKESRSIIKT